MAYTKYSLTPADNNAAPPNGAPEGMLPSAVNDTMRDMMSQIRDVGDGIRGGTYTMTAPVITGGSITGVALSGNTLTNPVITGGSINNTTVGATTRATGAFTTLASNGATTFTAGTASTSTTTGTAVITGGLGVSGRINAANFDGIIGANTAAAGSFTTLGASSTATLNTLASSGATLTGGSINGMAIGGSTAAAGKFTTLEATGVTTVQAGTVSAPALTTTGDTNTGIFFPAADTIAFAEGGVEAMRIDSAGSVGIGTSSPVVRATISGTDSTPPALGTAAGAALFCNTSPAYGLLIGTSTGGWSWMQSQRVSGAATAYDLVIQPSGGGVNIGDSAVSVGTGCLRLTGNIGVGGATPATSGKGITFPATQSASSDANTLDDYEEGTWTPEFSVESGLIGSWTYTSQVGYYTKIGNIVRVTFNIQASAKPTAGNNVLINLPFASNRTHSVLGYVGSVGGITYTSRNLGAGATQISLAPFGTTKVVIGLSGSARAYTDGFDVASMAASTNIQGVIIFETA